MFNKSKLVHPIECASRPVAIVAGAAVGVLCLIGGPVFAIGAGVAVYSLSRNSINMMNYGFCLDEGRERDLKLLSCKIQSFATICGAGLAFVLLTTSVLSSPYAVALGVLTYCAINFTAGKVMNHCPKLTQALGLHVLGGVKSCSLNVSYI